MGTRPGGAPRGGGTSQYQRQALALPQPRPVRYFTNDGNLNPNLLEAEAEKVAKGLEKMKASQLRRFYDAVVALRRRLDLESAPGAEARERSFEALRAEFKMLKARAVYANGRDRGRTFPDEMLQFVIDHVHAVKTARDFDAFYRHFQAVVAFHKYYAPRES
ncbi:MAG: type III-A CRISPR-associated protein Csm2 [Bryobacterales bacterium]|nr:type III-A CRISPR-associated protein Csm2 [Bryobacterales bacterium]